MCIIVCVLCVVRACGVCVCVCVCVCVRVRERRKIKLTAWGKKVPIPDGIRTCTSGIRAHRASDYSTRAGTPCVSQTNISDTHPPAPSWNTIMHYETLQLLFAGPRRQASAGPPLGRMKRVRERRKIELTVWGEKVPIPLNGIRTCTSGIRAHRVCVCLFVFSKLQEDNFIDNTQRRKGRKPYTHTQNSKIQKCKN